MQYKAELDYVDEDKPFCTFIFRYRPRGACIYPQEFNFERQDIYSLAVDILQAQGIIPGPQTIIQNPETVIQQSESNCNTSTPRKRIREGTKANLSTDSPSTYFSHE